MRTGLASGDLSPLLGWALGELEYEGSIVPQERVELLNLPVGESIDIRSLVRGHDAAGGFKAPVTGTLDVNANGSVLPDIRVRNLRLIGELHVVPHHARHLRSIVFDIVPART